MPLELFHICFVLTPLGNALSKQLSSFIKVEWRPNKECIILSRFCVGSIYILIKRPLWCVGFNKHWRVLHAHKPTQGSTSFSVLLRCFSISLILACYELLQKENFIGPTVASVIIVLTANKS